MSQYAAAHINPQGANQGIGLETARAVHATGATVFITARTPAKIDQAINDVKTWPEAKSESPVYGIELRLDSLKSVRAAAKSFLEKSPKLNLLILNAGVMATPEGKTEDGFDMQFGTNHLGHFLFFQLLKPALVAASTPSYQSRVISVSSMAHRMGGIRFHDFNFEKEGEYNPWLAYGQSKTANIYFTAELERKYGAQGLHALAVHPGVIMTNLSQHVDLNQLGVTEQLKLVTKSPSQGAATTIHAALSKEWEGRGGKCLSDCAEEPPLEPGADIMSVVPGYASWIYDEEAEHRLWEESNKLVSFRD
ncbi:hypothetical protein NW765_016732 [Fusarium oxysporum]|nr:hypothetical protein NW765_016732 [Fusarium oxysporum]KAJ4270854.1 hypothetical protein NW764_013735 [Fusarium oxysporum]